MSCIDFVVLTATQNGEPYLTVMLVRAMYGEFAVGDMSVGLGPKSCIIYTSFASGDALPSVPLRSHSGKALSPRQFHESMTSSNVLTSHSAPFSALLKPFSKSPQ